MVGLLAIIGPKDTPKRLQHEKSPEAMGIWVMLNGESCSGPLGN